MARVVGDGRAAAANKGKGSDEARSGFYVNNYAKNSPLAICKRLFKQGHEILMFYVANFSVLALGGVKGKGESSADKHVNCVRIVSEMCRNCERFVTNVF